MNVFSSFVAGADTVMNLWYLPFQEFGLSENAGFQLAKTEILLPILLPILLSNFVKILPIRKIFKYEQFYSFYIPPFAVHTLPFK